MEGEEPRWEELPAEVWQLVFQRVPLLDLITSGRSVCQRWNQIISDENVNANVHKFVCKGMPVFYRSVYIIAASLAEAPKRRRLE